MHSERCPSPRAGPRFAAFWHRSRRACSWRTRPGKLISLVAPDWVSGLARPLKSPAQGHLAETSARHPPGSLPLARRLSPVASASGASARKPTTGIDRHGTARRELKFAAQWASVRAAFATSCTSAAPGRPGRTWHWDLRRACEGDPSGLDTVPARALETRLAHTTGSVGYCEAWINLSWQANAT